MRKDWVETEYGVLLDYLQPTKYIVDSTKYDDKYNYGLDVTKYYLDKYSNIKKDLYLKQKIISFDFIPISEALNLSRELYKIFLIKDLKLSTLHTKIVSILKSSINKHESGVFIDYLLEYDTQLKLSKNTFKNNDYYSYTHIPVIKGVISDIQEFPIPIDKLEKYIDKLEAIDFKNKKIQKKFFEKYYSSKITLKKDLILEKDFLKYFSEQINK